MKFTKHVFLLFPLILIFEQMFSQKISLKDEFFVEYLKNHFPNVLDSSDSLIITEATILEEKINLYNIGVTDLTGLQFFTSVSSIDLSQNTISYLPPLNNFNNLIELNIKNANLVESPQLQNFPNLTKLDLSHNSLTSPPDFSETPLLEEIYLNSNLIKDIPDGIKNLQKLTSADLRFNGFSLNDLRELTVLDNYENIFSFSPQNFFGIDKSYSRITGDSVVFRTTNDSSVDGVSYSLWKDGTKQIDQNNTGRFTIDNLTETDNGYYNIRITSHLVPEFYRESNKLNLEIILCYENREIDIEVNPITCNNFGSITLNEDANFTLSHNGIELENNSSGFFPNLSENDYAIKLSKSICKDTTINITIERIKCNDYVLQPKHGKESIYLNFDGKILLYDKSGEFIGETQITQIWNGHINGTLLPSGYYLAVTEDKLKFYNISILP